MDRREFLRRALTLAPALVVVPTAVTYFLPPNGGWPERMTATEVLHRQSEWLVGWGERTVEMRWNRYSGFNSFDSEAAARKFAEAVNASHLLRPADVNWFSLDVAHG